jgi:hypothetical protein
LQYLYVKGWTPSCNNQPKMPHDTTVTLVASGYPRTNETVPYNSTAFKPIRATSVLELSERVEDLEDDSDSTLAVTTAVNTIMNRQVYTLNWYSHDPATTDNDANISLGLFHVNGYYRIDISDTGCNSGVAISMHVTARWGVDRGSIPNGQFFGGASDELETRFKLWWAAKDQDEVRAGALGCARMPVPLTPAAGVAARRRSTTSTLSLPAGMPRATAGASCTPPTCR